jgi:hypothetical protein
MTPAEVDDLLATMKVEQTRRDAEYRSRSRLVLIAGTVATIVVVGVITIIGSDAVVLVLLTVLAVATTVAVFNAAWWLNLPIFRRYCFGSPPHQNGSAALAAVLVTVTTVATIVHHVTGSI